MSMSDVENNSSMFASERSNVNTDDELFMEMMNAPPEFEDCLIPDHCASELLALEHLTKCLNRRFTSYPAIFMGPLHEALKEAFSPKDLTDRRPLLIYVNNDKSVYANLFCKQLLCNDDVIEYLMNNYVMWAWDVTYESNERKLNTLCKAVFNRWTPDMEFRHSALDRYPLLTAVSRDLHGNYVFNHLIEGVTKKLNVTEFLGVLADFNERFQRNEEQLKEAKKDAQRRALFDLFKSREDHLRPDHRKDRHFLRSLSMMHGTGHLDVHDLPNARVARMMSHGVGLAPEQLFGGEPPSKEDLLRLFGKNIVDSDDADDEDDENLRTPTVAQPKPKFS